MSARTALMQHMLRTALLLGLFAIIGTGLVAYTFKATEQPIAESQRAALLRSLHALVPPALHDNDLFTDIIEVSDGRLGSAKPMRVFRARQKQQPVAIVIETIAPDGYNGNIHLLVAIKHNGELLGVRVSQHRETPGLGDAIDVDRSDWIQGFVGRSLDNPSANGWRVKKDGGDFDQFTGATISPRAVVKAVFRVLQYYREQGEALFVKEVEDD
ncbi:electron transport complex subunit RsxG [Sulfuriflexus mobilis]|uniref:electron transport complex subunit RsxG n=1 Tax=Sulfuriflexus mobilis TaxID=1811807 RepID=UPI0015591E51|nr:electron transport complex subunit RsxG [Sulfuriflexus mobilis]